MNPKNQNPQDHQPIISVDIAKTNIDSQIIDFLDSLSYDGFILAGNSVANMIENIPIKGDLDFWVLDKKKYLEVLREFKSRKPLVYDVYPSMIEMVFLNLPIINLILSDTTAQETVCGFDFDYCRCYYTRQTGCRASNVCLDSISTKTICHETCYGDIRANRILKAIKYGYSFNFRFWQYFNGLLKDSTILVCDVCRPKNKKNYFSCHHFKTIQINDLNLSAFRQTEISIKISDINNIDNAMNQLEKIFSKWQGRNTLNLKLPKLFSFCPEQYELVESYANKIIILNPVRDGNYLEINFKNYDVGEKDYHMDDDDSVEDNDERNNYDNNDHDNDDNDNDNDDDSGKVNDERNNHDNNDIDNDHDDDDNDENDNNDDDDDDNDDDNDNNDSNENNNINDHNDKYDNDINAVNNIRNEDNNKDKYKYKNPFVHLKMPRIKLPKLSHITRFFSCLQGNIREYDNNKILNYIPNNIIDTEVIFLDNDSSSYIEINYLPDDLKKYTSENFKEMFDLHPTEKHKIIMYQKEVEVNRWQQSYLNTPKYEPDVLERQSYMYSGYDVSNNNHPLPKQFQIYYDYIKSIDEKYNQVVVNWYQNENDYIAYHSDCEIDMMPNARIIIISLYETETVDHDKYRVFSVIPKNGEVNSIYKKINIRLYPGIMITMGGDFQKKFKHGIEPAEEESLARISLSFRQFKNN